MTRAQGRQPLAYAMLAALLLYSVPVAPAIIEVNETCSLVDAIRAANDDDDRGGLCPPGGSGEDTLVLTDDVVLQHPYGFRGLPAVSSPIVIEGQGFTIERSATAEEEFGIFRVQSDLTIANATIGNASAHYGAAMLVEHYGNLILSNSTVSGNYASRRGGAIYNFGGTVTIDHSTLSGNEARYVGGAIRNLGFLTVTNSTLSGNSAGRGGALYDNTFYKSQGAPVPTATVVNTTFSGNSARSGGAIYNARRMNVTNSTFVGNSADRGGAIYNYWGTTNVANSTLSGNEAMMGGAIWSYGVMTVTSSTVTANAAGYSAGIHVDAFYELTLTGSIVAGNTSGSDCGGGGELVDGGGNFDGDGSCAGALPIVPGVDFESALADNGGPTLTHALVPGSVAQDAAGTCGLDGDQRGVPRDDGACDSGSFELVQGACCTEGPGVESECLVIDENVCEARGGLFLGRGSDCRPEVDCIALLVTMQAMSAAAVPEGVLVRWTTALETDTVGFRVLRQSSGSREKALQPVGPLVPAFGSEVEGGSYEVLDDSSAAARAIEYYVEDVDLFGRVTRHGPIVVERGARQRGERRVAR